MVLGGTGGANTKTGLDFEIKTDLKTAIIKDGTYNINDMIFLNQYGLKKYLKDNFDFDMTEHFGKYYKPDEAIIYNNELYIIEKKNQNGEGSIDEKIQTGPYKLLIYTECAKIMHLEKAHFIYLLSDKFKENRYTKHQIPYLINNGIEVYFNTYNLHEIFKI